MSRKTLYAGARLLGTALLAAAPAAAQAQAEVWPSKPVRLVVGFTPGSATDITGRMFAQKFSEAWGTTVAVENIPGAGGAVGVSRVAKSPPDGYSLMFSGNGALTIYPSIQAKPLYDVVRELAPISMVLVMPSILAVNNDVSAKTLPELIALAKTRKLSYATPGAATPQHIAGELLKGIAGVDITHVPYRGAVFTDVIGGRVTMTIQNAAAVLPTIRDGRLRAVAVTSLKRSPNMPEIPTVAESGYPGFEAISWFALLAPTGTPAPIIAKVHQESLKVVANADMRAKFAQLGLDTATGSPDELGAVIRNDIDKWAKVIKDAGITAGD